ncbi:fimbrial biogenesis chaperone [Cupriavidus sp. 30B13]|uniref:fimbrial biogenesis chaperone n=1 Tax=Cupriavidus sp. 30B13 TaxID=3384241 RepID=UPI003B8FAA0C
MNTGTRPLAQGRARRLRALAVLLLLAPGWAAAALSVVGTRFIYPAGAKELTVQVGNAGNGPILVQAWLDRGDPDADPARLSVPFVLAPPMFRLDAERKSVLRLRHTGEPLPGDRESVFWLNFLEVPALPEDSRNLLRLSYRSRMKLLYRPAGLPGSADEAVTSVAWRFGAASVSGEAVLEADNPTPYHVSFAQMTVERGGASVELGGRTLAPLGVTRIALPGLKGAGEAVVRYEVAKDSGELVGASVSVRP